MQNIKKHIIHWREGSEEAVETAEILINKKKIMFGLFFCHLAIEKALKALFIKINKDFPPKSHNLLLLAHKSDIELDSERKIFLSKMMEYQLEGRYPELIQSVPSLNETLNLLESTKEILKWLQKS